MQGIERATKVLREHSLMTRTKEIEQVTPQVVTFHPNLSHLTRILLDHQCGINISPSSERSTFEVPLVAYRQPLNLKDLLVRAEFKQQKETYKGNSPCKHPCCKTCAHIKTETVFSSTTTGTQFRVKTIADCSTTRTSWSADDVLFNTSEKQIMHSAFV